MPYGLRNAPSIFIAMMHDFKAMWTTLAHANGITNNNSNSSTIIVDDVLLYTTSMKHMHILLTEVCTVARQYHLTWKLKKCQWFPQTIEFVGVDLTPQGNTPAKSKQKLLKEWKHIQTPRDIMSFIGFVIFNLRWILFFEDKIKILRKLISTHDIDHIFTTSEYTNAHHKVIKHIINHLLASPILQRADANKRFYLKPDFSSVGLGFSLCQPGDSPADIAAMTVKMMVLLVSLIVQNLVSDYIM